MLLDGQLKHYDVVERHQTVVAASREATCRGVHEVDFVRTLMSVVRSVLEMRDVPPSIQELARRAEHLPPDTTFTLADVTAGVFVPLGERRGRSIILGAIGKLWMPHVAFVSLGPHEFGEFHEPKYVKVALAFWAQRFGSDKSVLRFEARVAGTDDSARTHLRRWYRVVRPYVACFMRQALTDIKAASEAITTAGV